MSNADGVLDQIDHALHAWDTSADAMRWTPEPVPARTEAKLFGSGGLVSWAPVGASLDDREAWRPLGHALNGFSVVSDPERLAAGRAAAASMQTAMRSISFAFQVQVGEFQRMFAALKSLSPFWKQLVEAEAQVRRSEMHTAYRRRQKRRNRR